MSSLAREKGVLLRFPIPSRESSLALASEVSLQEVEREDFTHHSDSAPPSHNDQNQGGSQYDGVFDRLSKRIEMGDAVASNERLDAPVRYAELAACPLKIRLEKIEGDDNYHSYLLAEMMLERCREATPDELEQAFDAVTTSIEIAQRLDEVTYGQELKLGLVVKSWAFLGNVLRHRGDLAAAEEAFRRVDALVHQLPAESSERVEALSLKASLLNDQNRFDEARSLLEDLVRSHRRNEDAYQLGKSLIKLGLVQGEMGDVEGAIKSQLESLHVLRDFGDDHLSSLALANLARALEDSGRSEEALKFLDQAGDLMERCGSLGNRARLRWLEGRIAASLGQPERAEEAFKFAHRFFSERAIDIEAASACLDLALLYARANRVSEIKQLAAEIVPVFQRQGLDREVMAALILFQHAAEKEIATLGLLQEIASYLKRTQEQPGAASRS